MTGGLAPDVGNIDRKSLTPEGVSYSACPLGSASKLDVAPVSAALKNWGLFTNGRRDHGYRNDSHPN